MQPVNATVQHCLSNIKYLIVIMPKDKLMEWKPCCEPYTNIVRMAIRNSQSCALIGKKRGENPKPQRTKRKTRLTVQSCFRCWRKRECTEVYNCLHIKSGDLISENKLAQAGSGALYTRHQKFTRSEFRMRISFKYLGKWVRLTKNVTLVFGTSRFECQIIIYAW